MTLLKPSEASFQTAETAAKRNGFAAQSELALRNALEGLCRSRWPSARVVHELVMGEGRVRADVVAIAESHIAAFEVKGDYDNTTRLLHQVGMYQLCVPEVWMVVGERHGADAALIRHLLPSVGLIQGKGLADYLKRGELANVELTVMAEATPRPVVPEMMLEMLWRNELASACNRTRLYTANDRTTRSVMIKALLALSSDQLIDEVCTELRMRIALWRADDPIGSRPDGRNKATREPLL